MSRLDRAALPSLQFWGLLITLMGLFLMGGSSRGDAQSLAFLNPAMVLCCGVASLRLRREHWRDKKWLALAVGLVFFVATLYLVPLPMQLGAISPGWSDVAYIRAAANVASAPQILAMAPYAAWQALFFLFSPMAVLLFAVQLSREDLRLTLPLVIVLGTISGILGVLQIGGSVSGPLYFYSITNNGYAVGLFANRNHAAVFLGCLFPILAILAVRTHATDRVSRKKSQLIAIAIAIILVPLILVTGSRSGMLTAIVGLIGGVLLYSSNASLYRESKTGKSLALILAVAIIVCLVFATIYFSRAEAIERIFAENGMVNDRADFWASSIQLFWHYLPFGFGPGSFVPAFQSEEPVALLDSSYLNTLHNDWLETSLAFGVSGILLMLGATAYYFRRTFELWAQLDGARTSVVLGRIASIIFAILAIASLSDYPLRTPAIMGLAALVCIWFIDAQRKREGKMEHHGSAPPVH